MSSEDLHLAFPGMPIQEVAARWLQSGCRLVVVTKGGSGVSAFNRSVEIDVEARPVDVVDTVGAGDTFQAALLTWLAEQGLLSIEGVESLDSDQLRSALEFAAMAASITCTRRGADLPRRTELA